MPLDMTVKTFKRDLKDKILFIHGVPKVGKSTLASEADGAFFLATEEGLGSLSVRSQSCPDWDTFTSAVDDLVHGTYPISTVIVDTGDALWQHAETWVTKKYGVDHSSDLKWGKGGGILASIVRRELLKLAHSPKFGLIVLAHTKLVDIAGIKDKDVQRAVPSLPDKARDVMLSMSDFILYAAQRIKPGTVDVEERVIYTKNNVRWEAGDRTGKLPPVLPLKYSALKVAVRKAYEALELEKGGMGIAKVAALLDKAEAAESKSETTNSEQTK